MDNETLKQKIDVSFKHVRIFRLPMNKKLYLIKKFINSPSEEAIEDDTLTTST